MAPRSLLPLLLALFYPHRVAAISATPNSPCASQCIDSSSLDPSDANSFTTTASDITCDDGDFSLSAVGQKWMSCMNCLQSSTFVQSDQNDQMWFLYNLRYNFDYCVFAFPNATGVATSPCTTSYACGPLQNALEFGNLNTNNLSEFAYCSDGSMTGEYYVPCLQCVASTEEQYYMANSLVGLEAGCLQEPAPGTFVGLNASVFTETIIGIVAPATLIKTATAPRISNTMIVGIAIAGIVVALTVAACIFVQYRKRRNRRARTDPSWGRGGRGIGSSKKNKNMTTHHRPGSSLSFRCQTHIVTTPKYIIPHSGSSADDLSSDDGAPPPPHDLSAFGEGAKLPIIITSTSRPALWRAHSAVSSLHSLVDEKEMEVTSLQHATAVPLRTITTPGMTVRTGSAPTPPPRAPVHQSPSSASRGSPAMSDHYFTTPTSATQLLPPNIMPYVPAEHEVSSSAFGADEHGLRKGDHGFSNPVSLTGGRGASPLLRQGQQQPQQPGWPFKTPAPLPPPKSPRTMSGLSTGFKGGIGKSQSGSSVETRQIRIDFPPPRPTR